MIPQTVGKVYEGKFLSCKSVSSSEGWIDAEKYIPRDLVLVELLILGRSKVFSGWINMKTWDGLYLKEGDKVICWRPIPIAEQSRRTRTNIG